MTTQQWDTYYRSQFTGRRSPGYLQPVWSQNAVHSLSGMVHYRGGFYHPIYAAKDWGFRLVARRAPGDPRP